MYIRDKIAASKAKGMWMGGTVPLGYTVKERQLVVNEEEAKLVRHIFQQYVALDSVHRLRDHLSHHNIKTRSGGHFFTGMLANMLVNPIYIGRIRHKDKIHIGNHKPIIPMQLWEQVQTMRKGSHRQNRHKYRALERSLLAGKIHDAEGHPMSCVHAQKLGRRYRYYISQRMVQGRPLLDTTITRIPAGELEEAVSNSMKHILHNDDLLSQICPDVSLLNRRRAQELANGWDKIPTLQKHLTIRILIARISMHHDHLQASLSRAGLQTILEEKTHDTEPADDDFSQLIPIKLKPVEGGATHILTDGPLSKPREPNPELVRAIAHGHVANRMLIESQTQNAIATQLRIAERQVRRVLPFGLLAPDIVTSILEGTQPPALSVTLLSQTVAHHDWPAQRARLATL